jgi:hypothetical protein
VEGLSTTNALMNVTKVEGLSTTNALMKVQNKANGRWRPKPQNIIIQYVSLCVSADTGWRECCGVGM